MTPLSLLLVRDEPLLFPFSGLSGLSFLFVADLLGDFDVCLDLLTTLGDFLALLLVDDALLGDDPPCLLFLAASPLVLVGVGIRLMFGEEGVGVAEVLLSMPGIGTPNIERLEDLSDWTGLVSLLLRLLPLGLGDRFLAWAAMGGQL